MRATEVPDVYRERVVDMLVDYRAGPGSIVDFIATALVEERKAALADGRKKERAKFLALADDMAKHTVEPETERGIGFIAGLDIAAAIVRNAVAEWDQS